jgi:hypothetical protein
MATESMAKKAARAALVQMGPAQGTLLPDGRQQGVIYTGKPGRPKGRKNDKTLMAEAGVENLGERALLEALRAATASEVAEARRIVCEIWQLPLDTKPTHIVTQKPDKTEDGITIYRATTLGELIEDMVVKCIDRKKNAQAIAMPFVQQKKPQQVDVTEKKTITIVQKRMDDDGLDDPPARAKNVTPRTLDHGDGL